MIYDLTELQHKIQQARNEQSPATNKIKMRNAKIDDASKLLQKGYTPQEVSYFQNLPLSVVQAEGFRRTAFPRQELVKAYKDADQNYELKGLDRVWDRFYPLVTANPKLREQEIQVKITQLYRLEDLEIPDLLSIEGMPIFHYEVDPQTDEVIANSTQLLDTQKVYTIPLKGENS
jgi:hypothetical protein